MVGLGWSESARYELDERVLSSRGVVGRGSRVIVVGSLRWWEAYYLTPSWICVHPFFQEEKAQIISNPNRLPTFIHLTWIFRVRQQRGEIEIQVHDPLRCTITDSKISKFVGSLILQVNSSPEDLMTSGKNYLESPICRAVVLWLPTIMSGISLTLWSCLRHSAFFLMMMSFKTLNGLRNECEMGLRVRRRTPNGSFLCSTK